MNRGVARLTVTLGTVPILPARASGFLLSFVVGAEALFTVSMLAPVALFLLLFFCTGLFSLSLDSPKHSMSDAKLSRRFSTFGASVLRLRLVSFRKVLLAARCAAAAFLLGALTVVRSLTIRAFNLWRSLR